MAMDVEEDVDGPGRPASCDSHVGADCPTDLPDSRLVASTPSIDEQSLRLGCVASSGREGAELSSTVGDGILGART